MPVNSVQKQEGRDALGRFEKGRSGNLKGWRPVKLGLPPMRDAADLSGRMAAVTTAPAPQASIMPGEASELAQQMERRYGTGA